MPGSGSEKKTQVAVWVSGSLRHKMRIKAGLANKTLAAWARDELEKLVADVELPEEIDRGEW